ncbi:phospholipid carrier-dependent glycosyltransferase [Arthrobacter sp. zg-Y20]|uniref:dolichyl-phosphate-mannose--protein mannosyltransferase n=1 Tax=unclassified Arthrobacter TaxID=235627 RepID=UPI001D136902|nr:MULTISPECIES: phospholipid carrier-dependent glycosyltransferase [unclassified Arthrobacter]MCC3277207.1 phospholipid carrier-dependent glycosyltransferase [Arthrobacter sp. zg-Y20]MDK1317366.1 phospholipid carrier-dependent glycosyltransferase [Arthrobacter sp. zg.Y20]WIB07781.1 phospholipid carrier-dependent glycosyltransferase [Arthrobacter sp. zg-Y20]
MALLGGVLRFVRLGEPGSLVFDETYYVKDAYSLLQFGYEREWPEDANDAFNAGTPHAPLDGPEYVVHPPVGKWMIALGMALFGADNGFGWRFGAALTGTLTVLLLGLIAARLFSSATLGGLAGMLLAVDGHHLVHSRTSLLDVFLTFWLVAAFGALLLDRRDGRLRLARALSRAAAPPGAAPPGAALPGAAGSQLMGGPWLNGPWLLWRPWRLVAGVCLGLAVGTKWSALAFVAVFGLMTVLWDVNARRLAGITRWKGALLRDGVPAFLTVIPAALLTYLAAWTGWFQSDDAYNRQWAAENPGDGLSWLPQSLRSLAEYHRSAYAFHNGLSSEHSYSASAWTWLFMGRPTSFYYESSANGEGGCTVDSCSSAVTSVGNPLIWWAAALSLLVVLFYWAGRRDWRAGAVLSGVAAGYLPWFAYPERTTFFFYAVSFEPFLVLALVYVLGLVLGRRTDSTRRRRTGLLVVGCFAAAVLLLSAFFMPVWTAETVPYSVWRLRMWMPSWI